MIDYQQQHWGT